MKPFLKWAGGKGQLLDELLPFFPDGATYFEPFIGAGALFFELSRQNRFYDAVIGDANRLLMETYVVVRDQPEQLIERLQDYKRRHGEELYYRTRDLSSAQLLALSPIDRAARFIYLNRTCYNGLQRYNKEGKNNVPIGDYKNPRICDVTGLRKVSKVLRGNIKLMSGDFSKTADQASPGDVVYLDPPYYQADGANFVSYTQDGFTEKDQIRLAQFSQKLSERDVAVIASNSCHDFVIDLWRSKGFYVKTIAASRNINSNSKGRGKVKEVILYNHRAIQQ